MVYGELKPKGYDLYLVHPEVNEISGQTCYPNLAALGGKAEAALICLPPAKAKQALQDAADAGIKKIWLQQGSESADVLKLAKDLGNSAVSGKCIMMYAQPVTSIHSFHKFFAKLFGQY